MTHESLEDIVADLRARVTSLEEELQRKRGSKKARRQMPEGFPFLSDLDWAQTLWLGRGRSDLCTMMGEEADKFRDHHNGRLTASADWPASWRTWARNAIKFSNGAHNGRSNGTRKPTNLDKHLDGIAELIDDIDARALARRG